MTEQERKRAAFRDMFTACQPALSAIGDQNRQLIIKFLMERCGEGGVRVGEIRENTNLSRTAISHHMKLLKAAGIIAVRREGTRNYYYLDPHSSSLKLVAEFWKKAEDMMLSYPDYKEDAE